MLPPGAAVVVGCSGGADSVALLSLLRELAPLRGLRLVAVYIDHRLREAAAAEGRHVVSLAAGLGVPAEVVAVDAAARVAAERRGLQQGARLARYDALMDVASRHGAQRIAVGHSADDQAETVLSRVLRGSGTRGLGAMAPVRGAIIRPLLGFDRSELRGYVLGRGLPILEDPSNAAVRFERVRLRRALAAEPRSVAQALVRLADNARDDEALIAAVVQEVWGRCARTVDGGVELDARLLGDRPFALVQRLALRALESAGVQPTRRAALDVANLTRAPRGSRTIEVDGGRIEQVYGLIRVVPTATADVMCRRCGSTHGELHTQLLSRHELSTRPDGLQERPDRVLFDAQQLPGPVFVRTSALGDRLRGRGLGGGHRKVADLFVDAKVPRWERACRPLLAVRLGPAQDPQEGVVSTLSTGGREDELLWVPLVRAADLAPVGPSTKVVLVATYVAPTVSGDEGTAPKTPARRSPP
jgi:tRNA(Ile)-lysidine synthase